MRLPPSLSLVIPTALVTLLLSLPPCSTSIDFPAALLSSFRFRPVAPPRPRPIQLGDKPTLFSRLTKTASLPAPSQPGSTSSVKQFENIVALARSPSSRAWDITNYLDTVDAVISSAKTTGSALHARFAESLAVFRSASDGSRRGASGVAPSRADQERRKAALETIQTVLEYEILWFRHVRVALRQLDSWSRSNRAKEVRMRLEAAVRERRRWGLEQLGVLPNEGRALMYVPAGRGASGVGSKTSLYHAFQEELRRDGDGVEGKEKEREKAARAMRSMSFGPRTGGQPQRAMARYASFQDVERGGRGASTSGQSEVDGLPDLITFDP